MEIILIVLGLLVATILVLFIAFKRKPELFQPLFRLLFKSKRIREKALDDPAALEQLMVDNMTREQARNFSSLPETQKQHMIGTAVDKAIKGEEITVQELAPAPHHGTASKKQVQARRNKNKRARQQRKKSRK